MPNEAVPKMVCGGMTLVTSPYNEFPVGLVVSELVRDVRKEAGQ
jgi:hypothetical protein